MNAEKKMEALKLLYEGWLHCERCGLCKPSNRTRTNVVFGEGNPDARLVVIGEAPGKFEDTSGRPFDSDGASGEVVDDFLKLLNSTRDEIFLMNIAGCRPTEENDCRENRKPTAEEVQACLPRVFETLRIIDPYVVLLLGGVALEALTGRKKIADVAENEDLPRISVEIPGVMVPLQWPAFATFHPSYLLRNWSEVEGGVVHTSFRVWKKAFVLADTYNEIYRGKTPPRRGENG